MPDDGIELPSAVKARLGLDDRRSWVILTEGNAFMWPGPDLRPLPGQPLQTVAYGVLPPRLFQVIRDRFVALARARRLGLTNRTGD